MNTPLTDGRGVEHVKERLAHASFAEASLGIVPLDHRDLDVMHPACHEAEEGSRLHRASAAGSRYLASAAEMAFMYASRSLLLQRWSC